MQFIECGIIKNVKYQFFITWKTKKINTNVKQCGLLFIFLKFQQGLNKTKIFQHFFYATKHLISLE